MVDKGYTHPDLLWSPAELAPRLSDPNLRIIDVRPVHTLVQEGWIPGAAHFDLFGLSLNNTAPEPLQAFMWAIEHVLELRGVNLDTPVVFYEDIAGMRAARGFWFLEYLGHDEGAVVHREFRVTQGFAHRCRMPEPLMPGPPLRARLGSFCEDGSGRCSRRVSHQRSPAPRGPVIGSVHPPHRVAERHPHHRPAFRHPRVATPATGGTVTQSRARPAWRRFRSAPPAAGMGHGSSSAPPATQPRSLGIRSG